MIFYFNILCNKHICIHDNVMTNDEHGANRVEY